MVEHFLEKLGRDTPVKRIDEGAMAKLAAHDWPGNVRELEHVLERGSDSCRRKPGADRARDRLRPVGELTCRGVRGKETELRSLDPECKKEARMSMEIETRMSEQIARYLDLAAGGGQADGGQYGQRGHARLPHGGHGF